MHNFIQNLKAEFHISRNLVFVVFVFCMAAVASFLATSRMQTSSAANLGNFLPGNIISDAVMANYSSMSVADIQNFLNSKNSCNNRDYNLYLQYTKAHPTITWHWEGEPYNGHFVCLSQERFGDGEIIGEGMTAAEIIYDAAQKNKINPQVLLVLLQKETSLITDKVPNSSDYRKATGYGCPDTAACDSKYYGFKNQVYRAAELFRYTLDNGYALYPEGKTVYVGYHPSSSCGGSHITIANRATAALYRYTPYQPNTAALNAGYGTGDVCSAYGNRNFYLYFTDWFGSTQALIDGEAVVIPDGEYTLVSQTATTRVLGVSGSNVELAALNDAAAQRWNIKRDTASGYYEIKNASTGKYLSVGNTDVDSLENVLAQSSAATCARQWKIYQTKDNYLTFESACAPGMVIDVDNASSQIGTNIQLWITNGCSAQKWKLRAGETIEPGTYNIVTKNNPNQNLDLAGGNKNNGTNIQIWQDNGQWPQRWIFDYDDNTGLYTITNTVSGKLLDLSGARTTLGTNIQTWQNTNACAQKWKVVETPDKYYTLISSCSESRVIDTTNSSTANLANVQLWEASNTDTQKWSLKGTQLIEDGVYNITAKGNSERNLDLAGGVDKDGTNIQLWETNGEWPQDWKIAYDANTDTYTIASVGAGGRLLDLSGAKTTLGTNIQLWSNTKACAQRWRIQKTEDGYYNFLSDCHSERAIDLVDGKTNNGNNIRLWELNGADAQKWAITPKTSTVAE